MKTVVKVALGIILGVLVLVIGCAALISGGIDETEEEQDATAISRAEFRSAKLGTPRTEIVDRFGEPEDAQTFRDELPGDQVSRGSCIYYNEEGQELFEGRFFQLCFENGKLRSKNSY